MPKTAVGGNSIDFYQGLKLDRKLNPDRKNYVQVCKDQELSSEIHSVKDLLEWERNILQEVDAKYDPDDDSEDEEKIKRKAALKAQKEAERIQKEEEAKAAVGARKKWCMRK